LVKSAIFNFYPHITFNSHLLWQCGWILSKTNSGFNKGQQRGL